MATLVALSMALALPPKYVLTSDGSCSQRCAAANAWKYHSEGRKQRRRGLQGRKGHREALVRVCRQKAVLAGTGKGQWQQRPRAHGNSGSA
jgi:hypothetical protein